MGLVKMGLVAGLLREKLWAYPVALAVLGLFFCYQMYRLAHTHSSGLGFFSLLDLIILVLIWREYKSLKCDRSGYETTRRTVMKTKILFLVAIPVAIAALIYGYTRTSEEQAADKEADQPVTAASRVHRATNSETLISLDPKAQQLIGLQATR